MKNCTTSMLMANFNNGQYIGEAIESVLKQTYGDWELIIVDDASTDDSISVIKGYLSDSRIKLYMNKKNLGCGAAKRRCLEEASGEIVGVLDPDDILDEKAMEIMVAAHQEHPDCGLVYSNLYKCDKDLNIVGKLNWVGKENPSKTNLLEPKVSAFRTFKKEVYKKTSGYDPELKSAVDKDIIYKLEEIGDTLYIDEYLYYYRFHEKGIASLGRSSEEARVFEYIAKYKAYNRRMGSSIPNYSKNEMAELMYEGFLRALLYYPKKCFWFLGKAIKLNPNIFLVIRVIFQKIVKK